MFVKGSEKRLLIVKKNTNIGMTDDNMILINSTKTFVLAEN